MPIPIYIIAAEYVVEDKTTGRSSIFNVIEKLMISKVPKPSKGGESRVAIVKQSEVVVSSSWTRTEKEIGDINFEVELSVVVKGNTKTLITQSYTLPENRNNLRFNSHILGIPGVEPGVIYLQHRARVAGTEEWVSQQYPLIVEEVKVEKAADPVTAT